MSPSDPAPHSLAEDAQGIVYAATMAAFGIVILTHLGLVTGQTAGLAVLISYATGWGFGPVFFAINVPFYLLGYLRMGLAFTVKTFLAVALLSGLSLWLPGQVSFASLNPWVGAVLFGFPFRLGAPRALSSWGEPGGRRHRGADPPRPPWLARGLGAAWL